MEKNKRLIEVYKFLAALEKHHGNIQGSIEETLASIEEELHISHQESMLLRLEAYRFGEIV